jgi:hypothetical protein
MGERRHFPSGVFDLYKEGASEENEVVLEEIESTMAISLRNTCILIGRPTMV